ncbi:MAG: AgmX/PglI C-terminal domain-containing protein [Deltaproteobacteria bacterium]|nr:AgmX/PglI C-terminal domain-containing protein [Deltaproteobacteria bacterium]
MRRLPKTLAGRWFAACGLLACLACLAGPPSAGAAKGDSRELVVESASATLAGRTDALRSVARLKRRLLEACLLVAESGVSNADVEFSLRLAIAADGKVAQVSLSGPRELSASAASCLAREARGWSFAPASAAWSGSARFTRRAAVLRAPQSAGGLGLRGTGRGGGGTGEGTIGLGRIGTLGRGSGGGYGSGYGSGRGIGALRRTRSAQLSVEEPVVRGELPAPVVLRIVRRRGAELRYCYEREMVRRASWSNGKVTLQVTVDAEGKSAKSVIVSSTLGARAIDDCIKARALTWVWPKPTDGKPAVASVGLVFRALLPTPETKPGDRTMGQPGP